MATSICTELGLGGEFVTSIAHMIREQVYMYLKCLHLIGYPMDGSPVLDSEASEWFLEVLDVDANISARNADQEFRPHTSAIRFKDRDNWTPHLLQLSEYELQSLEKDRDRIARRKRRGQRGRRAGPQQAAVDMFGFPIVQRHVSASSEDDTFGSFATSLEAPAPVVATTLPDMKDPPKTVRSLIFQNEMPMLQNGMTPGSIAWVQKYAGTKISSTGAANAASDLYEERSQRKGGRAAAHAALANISAIASSEFTDRPLVLPDRLAFERPTPMVISEVPLNPPPYSYANHTVPTGWRCLSCACSPFMTPSILSGPSGDQSLCNACGTYWKKHGTLKQQLCDTNFPTESEGEPITKTIIPRFITNDGLIYPLSDSILPDTLASHRQRLHEKYPMEHFDLVQVGNGNLHITSNDTGTPNCRIMCFECDPEGKGKLYALGPGSTMGNFENHLRNRSHRAAAD